MNAGWIEAALLLVGLSGCERIVAEPPPPPSRQDVPLAPPGARGARAAGTEGAPKPFDLGQPERGEPGPEPGTGDDEQAPDAGVRRPGKDVPL